MMYLSFTVGQDRYALPMKAIIDVVPAVPLKEVPQSPAWFAGLLHFRQHAVPVIDLCLLATGQASCQNMGRRIALLPYQTNAQASTVSKDKFGSCFAIMADMMVDTIHESDLSTPPQDVPIVQSPWLGKVACYQGVLLQLIQPQALINDELRDFLQQAETSVM